MKLKLSMLGLGLLSTLLNAQQCIIESNRYKSNSESTITKVKSFIFTSEQTEVSKVNIYTTMNNKCEKSHPLLISINNRSNHAIDLLEISIGSWLNKENGKTYYIDKVTHLLKDSIHSNFFIKANTKYSFCSKVPNKQWSYKKEEITLSMLANRSEPKKDKLIHTFKINELDYGLIKNSCFVGFHE